MKSAPVRREVVSQGRVVRPSVQPSNRTGRSVRSRRFQQVSVGVRRSPRAHVQTDVMAVSNDQQSDEESGPETVVVADTEVTAEPQPQNDPSSPTVLRSPVGKDQPVTSDEDTEEDVHAAGNASDADEMVDVVENDNDDDSTTRSLSTSLSPYEARQTEVTHDASHWLGDADVSRNSLLFDVDATNSMSSEADSVDVVSSLAVEERHTADLAATHDMQSAPTSAPPRSNEAQLGELGEFVDGTRPGGEDECVDSSKNLSGSVGLSLLKESMTEPSELTSSPQPMSTAAVPTHTHTDIRRGAMWRDSLFPSDFQPEPMTSYASGTAETDSGKSASVGKPGSAGKPVVDRGNKVLSLTAERTLSLDWEADRQHVDILSARTTDNQSPRRAASSSVQPCRQNFPASTPPISAPHYHYANIVDKSLDLPDAGSFRYDSGRRSVNDGYSRGLMYDAGSSVTQHPRAASVRPASAAAPSVDAQRLSHMWAGTPLPAHQHHVSLSHLQHLVTDDLQYAPPPPPSLSASIPVMPPVGPMTPSTVRMTSSISLPQNSAEFVRPCQQQQQHRQHGSRQQHKAHHKQTVSSSTTASQPIHGPAASLTAAAAAGYDMFSACRIQQPISYFPHQGAATALPMGVVGLHHAQMAVAAAANFAQPMPAGQAANSAMYSAAAAAAYSYLNGGGLQPFNVDINSVMRR